VTAILCPYTDLHPRTEQVLRFPPFARLVVYVHIDTDDPTGYAALMAQVIDRAETVVIVEHDVVPTIEQLETILSCDHLWCGYSYATGDRNRLPVPDLPPVMGLMRFDARLLARLAGIFDGTSDEQRHWRNVDQHIGWCAGTITDCVSHGGPVEHHHAWSYGGAGRGGLRPGDPAADRPVVA
jgi:hypothetical protein